MPRKTKARFARGFTLIEVLVALTVVALVLVALLGSMQAVVASATNIYDRTLAGWIAVDKVTEYRLATEFPAPGEEAGEVEMADIDWVYSVKRENISESPDILTVTVRVAAALEPEVILGVATGTLIKPAATAGGPPGLSGGQRLNGVGSPNTGGFGSGPDPTSVGPDGIPDFVDVNNQGGNQDGEPTEGEAE